MPQVRTHQRSFVGGTVAPVMRSQIADAFYQNGVDTMQNHFVTPTGSAPRRPGFMHIAPTKDSGSKIARSLTFKYSQEQGVAVEAGEGYFRFKALGLNLLHATPKIVTAVSAANDTLTFATAHGLASNTAVKLTTSGTMPGNLSELVTYYVVSDTSTTLKLSDTSGPGAAVNISSAGTGTLRLFTAAKAPLDYISSKNFTTNFATNNNLTATGHGYAGGESVMVVSTGTLPTGLSALTEYFVLLVDPNNVRLATSVGGTEITLTSNGTGTHRLHRKYVTGDTVSWSGTGPGFFYARSSFWRECTFDTSANTVLATAHTMANGTVLRFRTTSDLPTGLAVGTSYFIVNAATDTFQVSATYGGSAIDLTGTPAGTNEFAVFIPGDSAPPSATFIWHQMPDDGQYEIPSHFDEEDLPYLRTFQSGDVMTITSRNHLPGELRRVSATSWTFVQVATAPTLRKPTITSVTATRGEKKAMTGNPNSGGGAGDTTQLKSTTTQQTGHQLQVGETCFVIGGNASPWALGDYATVAEVMNQYECRLANALTGVLATWAALTSVSIYPTSLDGENSHTYQITALDAFGNESEPSTAVACTNNLEVQGAYNTLLWAPVSGADRYRIYRGTQKPYGYVAEVDNTSTTANHTYVDRGTTAIDKSVTPPRVDYSLYGTGNFPQAGCYFEQRRVFMSTANYPERGWMTRSSTQSDLTYHIPVLDADRIDLQAPGTRDIRHCVPLANLLLFTSEGEVRLTPTSGEALTPGSHAVRFQSWIGSSHTPPLVIGNSVLFYAARGGGVYEFGFSNDRGGYEPGDVSLRAVHLFTGETIDRSALMKAPYTIAWQVSSNGKLLGFTYYPREGIGGWHEHFTGALDEDGALTAFFEDICTVPEEGEDRLYAIVRRTIDGSTVRHWMRLGSLLTPTSVTTCNYLDDSVVYDGSNLTHLEGEDVEANNAGTWVPAQEVVNGTVSTSVGAIVGLAIDAEVITLTPAVQIDGFGQGRTGNVSKAWVRVEASCRFRIAQNGIADDLMVDATELTYDALGDGVVELTPASTWTNETQMRMKQFRPFPFTPVGLTLKTELAG